MQEGRRDDWIAKLEAVGVPCGPINNIAQAFAHPQAEARQLRRDLPHPLGGTAPVTASPLRFSDSPVVYRRAPPLLGEHTEEVLREVLNKSPAAIAELKKSADGR
ncbi:Succinyl-CoA:(R)-benzylsuccinate CoA-transferase subunit BbsF [compost metagenome]